MIAVQVRAYGDLNDFLRDAHRQREFGYRIRYPTSIKDPRPNPAQAGRKPLSEVASYNRMGQSSA